MIDVDSCDSILALKVMLAIENTHTEFAYERLISAQQKEKEIACIADFATFASKKCPREQFKYIAEKKHKELVVAKDDVIKAKNEYEMMMYNVNIIKTKLFA